MRLGSWSACIAADQALDDIAGITKMIVRCGHIARWIDMQPTPPLRRETGQLSNTTGAYTIVAACPHWTHQVAVMQPTLGMRCHLLKTQGRPHSSMEVWPWWAQMEPLLQPLYPSALVSPVSTESRDQRPRSQWGARELGHKPTAVVPCCPPQELIRQENLQHAQGRPFWRFRL